MAVKYKVVSKRPSGMAGQNDPRYYPALTDRRVADLRKICRIIEDRSSFTSADVSGMVVALINLIPELLQEGNNVRLDGLGTFSLHASSDGKDFPDKVTSRDIKKLKMTFLPDKAIKKQLGTTKFNKVK